MQAVIPKVLEWAALIYGFIMEGIYVTVPGFQIGEVHFLKGKTRTAIACTLALCGLGILYVVYMFVWMFDESRPVHDGGWVLFVLSMLAFMRGKASTPTYKQIDSAICCVCLFLIAWFRLKGW